ncbi:MAG TPA: SDR family oxidoreductase [Pseudonocardia sp.]|jgi:NAD(P)-dependent dehydrogenase (short-subunit alcohol dehydrogenase family)
MRLNGRVAIVTAAGRGIGRGVAIRFAREGAKVIVASLGPEECDATVDAIRAAGGTAEAKPTNVGVKDDVVSMVQFAVETYGKLNIVVNTAQSFGTRRQPTGSPVPTGVEKFTDDEIDWTFTTGLKGSLWAMQAAFPYLSDGGGRVINFGSWYGKAGQQGTLAYNLTKESIRALTRTAAREWAPHGITVNAINPAAKTDAAASVEANNPEAYNQALAMIPMGRMGDPVSDIAPVVVFLASEESQYVTGQTIDADGGLFMHP